MIETGIKIALGLSLFFPMGAMSQTPPANTYQEGFWQPIARVENPQFPIAVELVNKTGLTLDYGLTTDSPMEAPNLLDPGETEGLVLQNPEAHISIGYVPLDDRNTEVNFEYNITINSSESVTFEIVRTDKPDRVGDGIGTVLNIQSTGAIYIY